MHHQSSGLGNAVSQCRPLSDKGGYRELSARRVKSISLSIKVRVWYTLSVRSLSFPQDVGIQVHVQGLMSFLKGP